MTFLTSTSVVLKRRWAFLAWLLAVVSLGTVIAAQPVQASPPDPGGDVVQRSLDRLVRNSGFPAALAAVRDRQGPTRNYTAGVGDRETRADVPVDGRVRIGSNTKTFTAVVVLQLVGEGKVRLDSPIERYLPDLIRGDAGDGRRITVRQLLQHTSGLPDYVPVIGKDGFLPFQHRYFSPRELLDLSLAQKATFAPGAGWAYSNTNFVVAGLLVEAVTGRPLGDEVTRRTIDRIGLRRTSFPNVGDQAIRGPHPRGYHRDDPRKRLVDATRWDMSFGWAAGQVISTPSDLNRFFTALLDGRLLKAQQLREMRRTVPMQGLPAGGRYGLGLVSSPLSCGSVAWGHGGSVPGYSTTNAATDDGRAATIALTRLPTSEAEAESVITALDRALCAGRSRSQADHGHR